MGSSHPSSRALLEVRTWLSVIEAAVFFEAWLKRELRAHFQKAGVSESDIDAKFKKARGAPLSIFEVARDLVPEAFGFDFVLTQEGIDWAKKVKDKRNALVHGSDENVERSVAKEALDAVKAACTKIQSHM